MSKTDVYIRYCLQLDNRSHIGMKVLEILTGSQFLNDLISTFILILLNFLRKLVLYIFMIYRQSGQTGWLLEAKIVALQ